MSDVDGELLNLLLKQLQREWERFNDVYLDGALKPAAIELVDVVDEEGGRRTGRWQAGTRTIALSREFAVQGRWTDVLEVLRHEMAHQYAREVLGNAGEDSHGRAFRQAAEKLAVDTGASSEPELAEDSAESKLVRRIRKLLALAESPNQHEAEAAATRARRLMLEHNIALDESGGRRDYASRCIGPEKAAFEPWERMIAGLLGKHYFVRTVWVRAWIAQTGQPGQALEVSGTRENVELSAYVHDFLRTSADRLWRAHQNQRGVSAAGDRRRFLAGVMSGFEEQLAVAAEETQEAGLVWVGDPDLESHVQHRHPAIKRGQMVRVRVTEEFAAGKEAGRRLQMRRPIAKDSSPSRGRRLEGDEE